MWRQKYICLTLNVAMVCVQFKTVREPQTDIVDIAQTFK